MSDIHIINHTHWDREWFLTHEYTTAWIPALIDSLVELVRENPSYEFLFDGQTLVIEDLLRTRPDYLPVVQELVKGGNLQLGPLYSQPDWRLVSGELHMRNLSFGVTDAEALGGRADIAWLVDTFGHVSQAPQILASHGIDAAYVWRGVPEMAPLFRWVGADGTELATIDLFGGYRNLYGVSKTAEIAVHRLEAEVAKLRPAYGELPIPLFDGYDLDTEPEDPARFYAGLEVDPSIVLRESSRRTYADAVLRHRESAPAIAGELLSGKFGSTFPGSLSSRTYLLLLHHDAEIALHRRVEPLLALAAACGRPVDVDALDRRSRELLQNGVHDCICGVSIDQVHERMERSSRRMLRWADTEIASAASEVLGRFAPGAYAVSTCAATSTSVVRGEGVAAVVDAIGVGVAPVVLSPIRPMGETLPAFEWSNDHYRARLDASGLVVDGVGRLGAIVVRRDDGDTYSSEPGEIIGVLTPSADPRQVDASDVDTTVELPLALESDGLSVTATLRCRFSSLPLIEMEIDLDSTGTAFRIDAEFETGIDSDRVWAGMPFDLVERQHVDRDLFGHDIDAKTSAILMGQREVDEVDEFPFHDVVATTDDERTALVLARGIRSYSSRPDGTISLALRRSTEWVARTGLQRRSGDAGPAMYVPGARCERTITHQLAFVTHHGRLDVLKDMATVEAFIAPPLLATVDGGSGTAESWTVLDESLPLTSLRVVGDETVIRLWNPADETVHLHGPLDRRAALGAVLASSATVQAKEIVTAAITLESPPTADQPGQVTVLTSSADRAGLSRSRPAPDVMRLLEERTEELRAGLAETTHALTTATGADSYRLTHRSTVFERELLEVELSYELNQRLAESVAEVSIPDEADPTIGDIGRRLNDLRVQRRIYDYVVQALAEVED